MAPCRHDNRTPTCRRPATELLSPGSVLEQRMPPVLFTPRRADNEPLMRIARPTRAATNPEQSPQALERSLY